MTDVEIRPDDPVEIGRFKKKWWHRWTIVEIFTMSNGRTLVALRTHKRAEIAGVYESRDTAANIATAILLDEV